MSKKVNALDMAASAAVSAAVSAASAVGSAVASGAKAITGEAMYFDETVTVSN